MQFQSRDLSPRLSEKDATGFVAAFASAAEPVELDFSWRLQLTDPAGEMILEAAVNDREILDHVPFRNVRDLERKLAALKTYYNSARTHRSIDNRRSRRRNRDVDWVRCDGRSSVGVCISFRSRRE